MCEEFAYTSAREFRQYLKDQGYSERHVQIEYTTLRVPISRAEYSDLFSD
jgi:hypothetical protein